MEQQNLQYENLGLGAAKEMFDEALEQVLGNISDPNTDPKQARKITLEVTISPNDDRNKGKVMIKVKPTLATQKSFNTDIWLGKKAGRFIATEYGNPDQIDMFNQVKTLRI